MPVSYKVNKDEDFAWIRFGSRFRLQEVLDAVAGFRAEGGPDCRRIIEFERPLANFRYENIRRVAETMRPSGAGKAIALVANNELSREVCEAIVRQLPTGVPARIFAERAEAEAWLRTQPSSTPPR